MLTSSPGRFSLALEVGPTHLQSRPTSKAREKRPGDDLMLQIQKNKFLVLSRYPHSDPPQ